MCWSVRSKCNFFENVTKVFFVFNECIYLRALNPWRNKCRESGVNSSHKVWFTGKVFEINIKLVVNFVIKIMVLQEAIAPPFIILISEFLHEKCCKMSKMKWMIGTSLDANIIMKDIYTYNRSIYGTSPVDFDSSCLC